MKFNDKVILKAQDGAAMPMPEGAPAPTPGPEGAPAPAPSPEGPQGGPNPAEVEQQIKAMAQEIALQIGDPQIIMMLAQALMELAQGGAPAPAPAYQREGGRLKRIRH